MNDLLKRVMFGLLYGVVILLGIFSHIWLYYALIFIFFLFAAKEISRAFVQPFYPIGILGVLVLGQLIIKNETNKLGIPVFYSVLLYVSIYFIVLLYQDKEHLIDKIGRFFIQAVYIIFPFSALLLIPFCNETRTYDPNIIFAVFVMVWSTDSFAFFTGKLIGKHKMMPDVSPKKTIEGLIGGLGFTLLGTFLIVKENSNLYMGMALIVSVCSVYGDLIASMFKRALKIKDYGNLIPGHGGIIDRLDSIIFCAPLVYVYLNLYMYYVS